MKKNDIIGQSYLKEMIEQWEIPYLGKLNFDKINYGIELEFKRAILEVLEKELVNKYHVSELVYGYHWTVGEEIFTIDEDVSYGGELQSPIYSNQSSEWLELAEICDLLKQHQGYIDEDCSVHIHIGLDILGKDKKLWNKFLTLWAIYEPVLIQFASGEAEKIRRGLFSYAKPLQFKIADCFHKNIDIWNDTELKNTRLTSINLQHLIQYLNNESIYLCTIEFRIANGTLNPIIIQNLLRCYGGMLKAVKENNSRLNYYLKKYIDTDILYENRSIEYQTSEFDMALELVDIIFDNDQDKLCFLKQYTGGLVKDCNTSKKYQKTL